MQPVLQLQPCTRQPRQAELENYPTAEFSHNIPVPVIPSPQPKRVRMIHNTSFMARLIPCCVCPGPLQYFCFPCSIVVD